MSGGKDKGKGKKEERHSTRKGAGTIDKFTYKELGTGGGTKIALRGTTITISSDEEYEDVASPTMTVEPPSTPIGVPFDSATGKGKRFIFADETVEEEEEDLYVRDVLGGTAVVAPTQAVVAPTPAVVAPTTAVGVVGGWGSYPTTVVIPPGTVRTTIAALQAVAAGGSAVEAPTTVVEARTTAVVAAQTDPMEFPFVAYPRGTKWWLK
jgi:hypothetical protein